MSVCFCKHKLTRTEWMDGCKCTWLCALQDSAVHQLYLPTAQCILATVSAQTAMHSTECGRPRGNSTNCVCPTLGWVDGWVSTDG